MTDTGWTRQIIDIPIHEVIVALTCSGAPGDKIANTLIDYFGLDQANAAYMALLAIDRTGMKTQRDLADAVREIMIAERAKQ